MENTMLTLHSMSPARAVGVAALVLYAIYMFVSGAPAIGAVAIALALFFGRVAVSESKATTPRPGLSGAAAILVAVGSAVLFGVLLEPLGIWALGTFAVPVVAVAYWSYGLESWQAVSLGIGFVLTLLTALALVFASV